MKHVLETPLIYFWTHIPIFVSGCVLNVWYGSEMSSRLNTENTEKHNTRRWMRTKLLVRAIFTWRPREPQELCRCALQLIMDGLSMSFGAVKALPDQRANTKEKHARLGLTSADFPVILEPKIGHF